MPKTYVPQACGAILTIVRGVMPADVPTSLGGPPGGDIPARYAAVAYAGEDRPGVTGFRSPGGYGNTGQVWAEEFIVWLAISTAGGDQDGTAQMAVTDALVQSAVAAVEADRTLGGLLVAGGAVSVGNFEWSIEDGGSVVTCFVELPVSVKWGQ